MSGTGALEPVRFAALVAPAVDRVFRAGMRLAREGGGRELVARHGGGAAVGLLVEFRPALAVPGRVLTGPQWRAVLRYRDPAEGERAIAGCVRAGTLAAVGDGFRATAAGLAFLHEMTDQQDAVLAGCWGAAAGGLVEPLTAAHAAADGTGGPAYAATTPAYLPAGAGDGLRVLTLLSGLRYHRSNAHAAAWAAAGMTAAEIQATGPGPRRDAIEAETNRLAAPPWAALEADRRVELLAGLAALPG